MDMDKKKLRSELKKLRAIWEADYCARSDSEIRKKVLALDQWRQARCIFIYVSVRTEPDTHFLIRAALNEGKRVAVPVCEAGGIMHARRIMSPDELLPAGFGLLEPPETAPAVSPDQFDLAIIPCVAADRHMHRLGHGAGYYDRYLPQTNCPKICLCRGRELLDSVPTDEYDVKMDMIITEDK